MVTEIFRPRLIFWMLHVAAGDLLAQHAQQHLILYNTGYPNVFNTLCSEQCCDELPFKS